MTELAINHGVVSKPEKTKRVVSRGSIVIDKLPHPEIRAVPSLDKQDAIDYWKVFKANEMGRGRLLWESLFPDVETDPTDFTRELEQTVQAGEQIPGFKKTAAVLHWSAGVVEFIATTEKLTDTEFGLVLARSFVSPCHKKELIKNQSHLGEEGIKRAARLAQELRSPFYSK